MKNLNWAILGTGQIAAEFAEALQEVQGGVFAVGSRTMERARAFTAVHPAERVYGSYSELLQDPAVDVVYIATPHVSHHDLIMESLKEDKHVLCEKPITVNGRQLQDVVDLADDKNRVVAEAMTIYHLPLMKRLQEIVHSGQLGPLKMIQAAMGSCKPYDVTNRFFNKELAGGALLDIGTYALSLARYFLSSQPDKILSTVRFCETDVDEQSGILLQNGQGEIAVIALTLRAKMPQRAIIAGEKGLITINDFPRADRATITWLDGHAEEITAGDTHRALAYEIIAMNHCIQDFSCQDQLPLSVDVMAIMDEVRRQWDLVYPFE